MPGPQPSLPRRRSRVEDQADSSALMVPLERAYAYARRLFIGAGFGRRFGWEGRRCIACRPTATADGEADHPLGNEGIDDPALVRPTMKLTDRGVSRSLTDDGPQSPERSWNSIYCRNTSRTNTTTASARCLVFSGANEVVRQLQRSKPKHRIPTKTNLGGIGVSPPCRQHGGPLQAVTRGSDVNAQ